MAIKRYAGDKIVGLSTDTKPLNVPDGATFYESDTLYFYQLVAGIWERMHGGTSGTSGTSGSSGSSGIDGADGSSGTSGSSGSAGSSGTSGHDGSSGTSGSSGSAGSSGSSGSSGTSVVLSGSDGQMLYTTAGQAIGAPSIHYDPVTGELQADKDIQQKAMTAPSTPAVDTGKVYMTANGTSPNREVRWCFKNEHGEEIVISSTLT